MVTVLVPSHGYIHSVTVPLDIHEVIKISGASPSQQFSTSSPQAKFVHNLSFHLDFRSDRVVDDLVQFSDFSLDMTYFRLTFCTSRRP